MRTTIAAIALTAAVPFLAAFQSTPAGEAPKVAPPSGGTLGSVKTTFFMKDGTPIKAGQMVQLFNGTDTKGWKAFVPDLGKDGKDQMSVWSVADGCLKCAGNPIGYIRTTEKYENFELELEWRFDPKKGAGNSGVLLRTIGEDMVWPNSMEAQLHSENAGDIWNIGDFPMKVAADRTNGRHTRKDTPPTRSRSASGTATASSSMAAGSSCG